jgi:hypothetical protein
MSKKDILQLAKERYRNSTEKSQDNRKAAKEDIEFAYNIGRNGQWPKSIRDSRKTDKRPCLTVNLLDKFVGRLVGEERANRPGIKVRPVDNETDPDLAGVFNDIIKSIENNSSAAIAYDTAYEHAVSGGFGYYRILTQYVSDDSFDQEIAIKRILNPFTVEFDQDSVEFDFSDARYCFILEDEPEEEFKEKYPKANSKMHDFNSEDSLDNDWWGDNGKTVKVAEYYYKEPITKTLIFAVNGIEDDTFILDNQDERESLEAQGYEIIKEREVKTHKVMWAKLSGNDVLEGPREINCKYIPVVPVLGQEIFIDGIRRFRSLIRDAKDPQRAYNYYRSMAAESISLVPKSPFLLTPDQIKGHETMWQNANISNKPYLLVNASPHGLPQRQPSPQIPTGAVEEGRIAKQDLEDSIGLFSASLGRGGNERSGTAISRRVEQSNAITYSYIDNFRRALLYTGRILIDMIPRVYDTERIIRLRGNDEKVIEINKSIYNAETDSYIIKNDISVGKYDVAIDIGTDYSTKRAESADMLIQILQYVPDLAPAIIDLVVKNMDIPGGEEIIERIQQLMGQGQPVEQQPNLPEAG